jgi:hypothetical protein
MEIPTKKDTCDAATIRNMLLTEISSYML